MLRVRPRPLSGDFGQAWHVGDQASTSAETGDLMELWKSWPIERFHGGSPKLVSL
jgi:hypothetical protein